MKSISDAEYKHQQRLRRIPKNWTCPRCGEIKLASSQWFVPRGRQKGKVMCLACRRATTSRLKKKLPKDMICPHCLVRKVSVAQWVAKDGWVGCRACNLRRAR